MKRLYLFAFLALAILAASAASAYMGDYGYNSCYVGKQGQTICTSCPSPAWNRTPIYVVPEGSNPCVPPNVPQCGVAVDPWTRCGAFCYGGQTPQGWPYGWCSEYWLRPDSNL